MEIFMDTCHRYMHGDIHEYVHAYSRKPSLDITYGIPDWEGSHEMPHKSPDYERPWALARREWINGPSGLPRKPWSRPFVLPARTSLQYLESDFLIMWPLGWWNGVCIYTQISSICPQGIRGVVMGFLRVPHIYIYMYIYPAFALKAFVEWSSGFWGWLGKCYPFQK